MRYNFEEEERVWHDLVMFHCMRMKEHRRFLMNLLQQRVYKVHGINGYDDDLYACQGFRVVQRTVTEVFECGECKGDYYAERRCTAY